LALFTKGKSPSHAAPLRNVPALPGALLYQLSETGIDKVEYEDTEHYRLTREFLLRRELFFRELFAAEE